MLCTEIPSNIVPSEVLWADPSELGLCDEFAGRIVDYAKFVSLPREQAIPHRPFSDRDVALG